MLGTLSALNVYQAAAIFFTEREGIVILCVAFWAFFHKDLSCYVSDTTVCVNNAAKIQKKVQIVFV